MENQGHRMSLQAAVNHDGYNVKRQSQKQLIHFNTLTKLIYILPYIVMHFHFLFHPLHTIMPLLQYN